jgi:hypothetical protein
MEGAKGRSAASKPEMAMGSLSGRNIIMQQQKQLVMVSTHL